MSHAGFARTPQPPYYAVIFTSQRHGDDAGYGAMAERMAALAARQPGFLGLESARGASGLGITVSYWESEAAITDWKRNVLHGEARRHGRESWYAHFELRVTRVERAYAARPKSAP